MNQTPNSYFVITLSGNMATSNDPTNRFMAAIWERDSEGAIGQYQIVAKLDDMGAARYYASATNTSGAALTNSEDELDEPEFLIKKIRSRAALPVDDVNGYAYNWHTEMRSTSIDEVFPLVVAIAEESFSNKRTSTTLEKALSVCESDDWSDMNPDEEVNDEEGKKDIKSSEFKSRKLVLDGDVYWTRKVQFGNQSMEEIEMLQSILETQRGILLGSAPGTGKTAAVRHAFPGIVEIHGHDEMDVIDMFGGLVQNADGTIEWRDGKIINAALNGTKVFIDEFAMIRPSILTLLYSPLASGSFMEIEGRMVDGNPATQVKVTDGFGIVLAYNPNVPGAVLSKALASRCTSIGWSTDYERAQLMGVDSRIVVAAKEMQTLVEGRSSGVDWAPQMRELLKFHETASNPKLGFDFAVAALISSIPADSTVATLTTFKKKLDDKLDYEPQALTV